MKRLAVMASGNGSNFEALAAACADGRLDARIEWLVCDRPGAFVTERARKYGIPVFAADPKSYPTKGDYEREVLQRLQEKQVELVCLAGYMRIVSEVLLDVYGGRMINIHPSLLPSFKGAHAIRDAYEYGVKVYGVTIHYVDDTLDGGRIVAQQAIPYEGDDMAELEGLIHAAEHALYVDTVRRLTEE